jgi:hypothetical protein
MKKRIITIISVVFVLGLNIYFRAYPAFFPQLKNQAGDAVGRKIFMNAAQEINQKFAGYSEFAKGRLLRTAFSEHNAKNKKEADRQINEEYLKLKDRFQDKYGQTYLMELDCWNFARYVDNVNRHGHPGDQTLNGKEIDKLMLNPDGGDISRSNFLYYCSSFLYKLFSLFKQVNLHHFLFYLPLFFAGILFLALYSTSFWLGGNLAAVISCLFVGLAPIFLPRSCAGWFDSEIFNLLFPLLAVFFYVLAYDSRTFWNKLACVFIASFIVGLYSFVWFFWAFIFFIILFYEFFAIANLISEHWQYKEENLRELKEHLLFLPIFIISAVLWVMIFVGPLPLINVYAQILQALGINSALAANIWPNVFYTVGELKRNDFRGIALQVGGMLFFLSAVASMLTAILNNKKYQGAKREFIFVLVIWFMVIFFIALKGVRFSMFLLIPLGICLGSGLSELFKYGLRKRRRWVSAITITGLILFGSGFIANGHKTAVGIFPLMDDTWYSALTTLKNKTSACAIINSWWDFGDWFKAASERRVIFDGQSQNNPQAYWMARVLLSDNEQEAMAILRMLNLGGNKAFEIMNGHIKDPFKTIHLLRKVILWERQEAEIALSHFLPAEKAAEVLKLLYAKPPEAYFVLDSSMIGKMAPISYLGNWDFTRIYLTQNINKKGKKEIMDYLAGFGVDNKTSERLYQEVSLIPKTEIDNWVSRRFVFYSGYVRGQNKDGIVLFDNGFVYNPKEQTVYSYFSNEGKYKTPKSLFIKKEDGLAEIIYPNSEADYSALVLEDAQGYQLIVLSPELAKSLFVRLYFLNGTGLSHFKPFAVEKSDSVKISIFQINW